MTVLGKTTTYPTVIDASILEFIPRSLGRSSLTHVAPHGIDYWTGYEFSWLSSRGSPEEAILKLHYSAQSTHIVESKSLKLYLGGFASTRFGSKAEIIERISSDLRLGLGVTALSVELLILEDERVMPWPAKGYCIDIHELKDPTFEVNPSLLRTGSEVRDELMFTNSFRSLCPVTGQPDWATVSVLYKGKEIMPDSLRAYLCSYRNHQGFHESCCEAIFSDISRQCSPDELSVACSFTRRGGIDITPIRSSSDTVMVKLRRTFRQ